MGIYSDWTVKNPGKEGVLVNAEFVLKMLDKIIDIIYPVGFYYIQFAGKNNDFLDDERPQSLFSGTSWQQLWSGEGVYFQTEGGGSMRCANGLQGDAVRNIAGTVIGSLNSDIEPFRGAQLRFTMKVRVVVIALLTGNTTIKADTGELRWIYQRAFPPIPAIIPATG
jgi:hypothetical protein